MNTSSYKLELKPQSYEPWN